MSRFEGQTALVTGGARGIGAATERELEKVAAMVAAVFDGRHLGVIERPQDV